MRQRNSNKNTLPYYRTNDKIRASQVRLLDGQGQQIGVVSFDEAKALAIKEEKDLVEIAPLANPPVVKLIEFSKFLYWQKKKKQEEKRSSKTSETKQIRMTPFIGEHDLEIKLKKAREFITDGDKVKFGVRMVGRASARKDLGRAVLEKVIAGIEDIAKIEREIHEEGRQMVMLITKK